MLDRRKFLQALSALTATGATLGLSLGSPPEAEAEIVVGPIKGPTYGSGRYGISAYGGTTLGLTSDARSNTTRASETGRGGRDG